MFIELGGNRKPTHVTRALGPPHLRLQSACLHQLLLPPTVLLAEITLQLKVPFVSAEQPRVVGCQRFPSVGVSFHVAIDFQSDVKAAQENNLDVFTSPDLRRFESSRYITDRSLAVVHCNRRALRIEKRLAIKRARQIEAQQSLRLEAGPECGEDPYAKAQQMLEVARAVQETLGTERKLVTVRGEIAELQLRASEDAVDAAYEEVKQADRRLRAFVDEMILQGLLPPSTRVSPTPDSPNLRPRRKRRKCSPSISRDHAKQHDRISDRESSHCGSHYELQDTESLVSLCVLHVHEHEIKLQRCISTTTGISTEEAGRIQGMTTTWLDSSPADGCPSPQPRSSGQRETSPIPTPFSPTLPHFMGPSTHVLNLMSPYYRDPLKR
jgi:hypothetical protein